MTEPEIHREIGELKSKVADMDADVRVTKHAVANMQQQQNAVAVRLDKLEERLGVKIDNLSDKLEARFEGGISDLYDKHTVLNDKITAVNTQQARGTGFFAGVAAVVTIAGGLLLALGKLLFAS